MTASPPNTIAAALVSINHSGRRMYILHVLGEKLGARILGISTKSLAGPRRANHKCPKMSGQLNRFRAQALPDRTWRAPAQNLWHCSPSAAGFDSLAVNRAKHHLISCISGSGKLTSEFVGSRSCMAHRKPLPEGWNAILPRGRQQTHEGFISPRVLPSPQDAGAHRSARTRHGAGTGLRSAGR